MHPRLFVLAALSCLLVACGGGGGGGGGNVPPPSSSSGGTFTLAQSSVTFDARTDGPPVLDSSVGLQVLDTRDVAVIGAAYVAPNQPQDWLSVGITGSGANYSVDLTANWIGKAPGTYTAIISIGTTNSAGRILQRRDLTVTLTVTEITVIAEPGPYGRAATFGHSDVLHPMTIHVNAPAGRTWNVTSTVPWIHVPGATFTGIQDVELFVDSSTLSLGEHQGELRFTSLANTNDNTTRPVVVEVRPPELTLGSSLVTLGGQDGNGARETSVLATLDTGTNSYPLTLTTLTTSGGNWLTASTNSSNIGSFATALTLAAKATIGTPGRYAGAVRVDANVRGQVFTRTVDVRYNQDQDRLVAATLGVSFSRLPTRSVLRRKVRIYDSAGRSDIAWSASDDASWLSVTPGGNTGGDLELVADATNLAPGQIYYATVTVSSSSTLIDNEERIRVALKVSSTDTVNTSVEQTAVSIVANPVEPWVYASLPDGDIEVRDVHSGALVDTFDAQSGAEGGALAISDDGLTLFAIDGWVTQRVRVLDARTGADLGEVPLQNQYASTLHYVRPNAHPILITGYGEAIDVATRTRLEFNVSAYYPSNKFAHSGDQRFLYSQQRYSTPATLAKVRLAYSTLVPSALVTEYLLSSETGVAGADVCVSADDSRVMISHGSFTHPFTLLNASDLSVAMPLAAQTYSATTVSCLWNGLYMGTTWRDPPFNLFFYDAQGDGIGSSLLYALDHEPMRDRVIVSGDASRVIAVTGGPSFHTSFYDAPLVP